jgi:hypothetical protein
MLKGFSLPLLFDLAQYDFSTVVRLLGMLVFWLAICALLISTFMSGGVLTVLATPDRQPFLEHFFAGAGRYFLRFFRLLLGAGLCAGVVLLGLNAGLGVVSARMSRDASELTPMLLAFGQGVVTLVIGTVFLLALHYARIQIVVDGRTDVARTYLRSLGFVVRNILRVFALVLFFAVLTGAVYLLYFVVRDALPTTTWLPILVLMAVQQIAVLARSAFQVGLYGAELQLFLLRRPAPPEPVAVVPLAEAPETEQLAPTDTD